MNRRVKALLLLICLLPLSLFPGSTGSSGQTTPLVETAKTFPDGEELLYEVSWWFVKLGTIRVKIVETGRDTNGVRLRARADIDSYAGVPFADLHVMTETVMDSACYSTSFVGRTKDGDVWKTIQYRNAKEKGLLFVERGVAAGRDSGQSTLERTDTLTVKKRYQDGVSILYFARASLRDTQNFGVTTIVEGAKGRTVFEFPGEHTSEEIDAVKYPIDVIAFRGKAEFEGIFGLRGPFEGWFSNDDARIPIRANMEVLVGSVKVELIQWHRLGWNPPRRPSKE